MAEPSETRAEANDPAAAGSAEVRVWDPLVRVFHWSLVVAFAVAYLTEEEQERLHNFAGYVVAALVAFRLVWGVIGPRHARFTDFVYRPSAIAAYLRDLRQHKPVRVLGHNPAGGTMVVAMLVMLAVTGVTGHVLTLPGYAKAGWLKVMHEAAANLTLALIVVHVAGVLVMSVLHCENLTRAMFTGRKRAE